MMALVNLVPSTEMLQIYEADLGTEGSFDEVIHGSHYVFHLASPAPFDASNDVCALFVGDHFRKFHAQLSRVDNCAMYCTCYRALTARDG